jgi:CBS domain-containing protein
VELSRDTKDILKALHSDVYIKNSSDNAESLDSIIEIKDILSPNPYTIKEHDTVEHAVQLFDRFDFNALPVVNDEGNLVGIITTKDIIGYLPIGHLA